MDESNFTHWWHFDGRETSLRAHKDGRVLAVILHIESLNQAKLLHMAKYTTAKHTTETYLSQSCPLVPYEAETTVEDLAYFAECSLRKLGILPREMKVCWLMFPVGALERAKKRREDGTAQPAGLFLTMEEMNNWKKKQEEQGAAATQLEE